MRIKRRFILFILLLLITTATSGCKEKEDVVKNNESTVLVESENRKVEETTLNINEVLKQEEETPVPTYQLMNNKELYIYSINSSTLEKESITALVPEEEEITPQLIVDTVIDSLEDGSFLVEVDEVIAIDNIVTVSFAKEYANVVNVTKEVELKILDVIAQSLLDNLSEYRKVIFQVNGNAYQSKNLSFGIDEVYLEKAN